MAQPTPEIRAERRRLRALRLALRPAERARASRVIVDALRRMGVFRRGRRVALYLAMPGEVDLAAAIQSAFLCGAEVYVPRVTSRRRASMRFARLESGSALRSNAFGIAEPTGGVLTTSTRLLDVVVLPVVGFDRAGNRIGMGAGYYDRALHHRRDAARRWRRPRLIGVAFACQEAPPIRPAAWDVALDAIVTERELIVPAHEPTPPVGRRHGA